MKVFVISLAEADARRRHARGQLRQCGVSFEFFDAIRGDVAIAGRYFNAVDEAEFILNTGRRVSTNEIGCFASHRQLWRLSVGLGEPIVIMEDDFRLLPSFAAALRIADELIGDVGFLRLQTTLRSRESHVTTIGDFELKRFTKPPHGTMCYCVSPRVASRFVELTRSMDAPVDVFTKKYWENGQPMYALTPFTVTESEHAECTCITGRKKTQKKTTVACRRLGRKVRWHVARLLFNARQRPADRRLDDLARNSLTNVDFPTGAAI